MPSAISRASYRPERHNSGVTEFVEIAGRGHPLTTDSGWREVAERTLEFIQRFASDRRSGRLKGAN